MSGKEGEEMTVKCKICHKEAVGSGYCALHEKAYHNIVAKFVTWKQALSLSWEDYLNAIIKNPFSGSKAIEVANALLSNPGKDSLHRN
jgi:glycine/serine hydroxymethyltransferase